MIIKTGLINQTLIVPGSLTDSVTVGQIIIKVI